MTTDDGFEVMTVTPPALSADDAAGVLDERYNLSGALEQLPSERDQNFLVTTRGGEHYVLRIANSAEDRAVTDFQTGALLHIAGNAPELPVPRPIRNHHGNYVTEYVAADGREHLVRVLTWLEGIPKEHSEPSPDYAATLGRFLAHLGHALRDYRHSASGYALLWDLKNVKTLRRLLERVNDASLRALCTRRLDVFETHVLPEFERLRWQVIHNDLNPDNVLVDPEETDSVTGVIDFGDLVCSPLVVDVAVAAAYLLRDDEDALKDVRGFVAGYCGIEPLEPAEFDVLFDLVLSRLTMTILITHWRATRYPENRDYILRSEAKAQKMLRKLSAMSNAEVTTQLRRACGID
jgi:Ser/Thr protein kinase RdoA (MazF antagonist)